MVQEYLTVNKFTVTVMLHHPVTRSLKVNKYTVTVTSHHTGKEDLTVKNIQ